MGPCFRWPNDLRGQRTRLASPGNLFTLNGLQVKQFPVDTIEWADFEKVELRAGTIVSAEAFPEARKAAYKLTLDFGPLGIRTSSAQITTLYAADELVGLQVVAVINFPPKRIAGFQSQCLVTGFPDSNGDVVLVMPTHTVPNGAKLF